MNVLERAGREIVDAPKRPPSPLALLERRASHLRRRRRVQGTVLVSSMVLLVVIAAVAVAGPDDARDGAVSVGAPSTNAQQPSGSGTRELELGSGTPFVPPTETAVDQSVLPVTLLNGDTISLQYPNVLRLSELGFVPGTAIRWEPAGTTDCCDRTVEVRYGTIQQIFAGYEPAKTYRGGDGHDVPYFTGTNINYLAFQIGDWVVAVPDYEGTTSATNNTPMNDEQRATYAASIVGHETEGGFLVLTPEAPLTLSYTDTPSANFGDGTLSILYRRCAPNTNIPAGTHGFTLEARNPETGTWLCYNRIPVVVHVSGTQTFQQQVVDGLQIPSNHQSAYG